MFGILMSSRLATFPAQSISHWVQLCQVSMNVQWSLVRVFGPIIPTSEPFFCQKSSKGAGVYPSRQFPHQYRPHAIHFLLMHACLQLRSRPTFRLRPKSWLWYVAWYCCSMYTDHRKRAQPLCSAQSFVSPYKHTHTYSLPYFVLGTSGDWSLERSSAFYLRVCGLYRKGSERTPHLL